MSATYDAAYYAHHRPGAEASAKVIVAELLERLPVTANRAIDVGAGGGAFVEELDRYFASPTVGIDGNDRFGGIDLEERIDADGWPAKRPGAKPFDLALCLEVAEHLTADRGPTLIDDLVALAPVVCFSAAIPGQGGRGHINERPASYWSALFLERGYAVSTAMREALWRDTRVDVWYRQNVLLAIENARAKPDPIGDRWELDTLDVIHPELFARKIAR